MNKQRKRKVYLKPEIELIKLDNEISLSLNSNPAAGPGEPGYQSTNQDYFKNDPYKLT